ncbi:MAG: peptide chain release factor N(5)-glutamine methyltransferase, partial [Myxococcales bacterium]|nr:peptide chain release factor N(5)-glutamine methyltransferase [Myxococcales bacterium]
MKTAVTDVWTIQRLLLWTSDFFTRKGIDSPRLTADLLLAHALGVDRVRLYVEFDRPIDEGERVRFRELVQRRAAREPTHYLTGSRVFFGRPFSVDARVLIPRPETEHLVEAALACLPSPGSEGDEVAVLDLCTGSGCLGLTLLAERPDVVLVATDLSLGALDVARHNARSIGVEARVEFLEGDLFAPVPTDRRFDLVVSNPPYVPRAQIAKLSPEVQREPAMALDGGEAGLDLLKAIVEQAPAFLKPGATLCLEIGEDQGAALLALLASAGFEAPAIERDFAGL